MRNFRKSDQRFLAVVLFVLIIFAALSSMGCTTMSPTTKKVVGGIATVLVVGAVAAHGNGGRHDPTSPADATCGTGLPNGCRPVK